MEKYGTEKEAELLRELALKLPEELQLAEERGVYELVFPIWGYELVYYRTAGGWFVFLSDTAD